MNDSHSPLPTKYHSVLIMLHWLMLVFIASAYMTMEFSDFFPEDSSGQIFLKTTHFSLGVSILLLVLIRIGVRLSTKIPAIIPAPNTKQTVVAKLMHIALYIFMIAMPLLGWLIISTHGSSVPFWGLQLPPLVGESKELHHLFHEMHEMGATLGYFLIGLHAAAGLFHHYKLKDNTLLRMSFLKK
jgi:superoxide oxidase